MKPARPLRFVLWLLERCMPEGESMAGDLLEQFNRNRSAVWLCRQVVATIILGFAQMMFDGREIMKRMASWMLVLLCVFATGFLAGRSPLLLPVEPPPPIAWKGYFPFPSRREKMFGTLEFLQTQRDKALAEDRRHSTVESRLHVQDLDQKVAKAKRSRENER